MEKCGFEGRMYCTGCLPLLRGEWLVEDGKQIKGWGCPGGNVGKMDIRWLSKVKWGYFMFWSWPLIYQHWQSLHCPSLMDCSDAADLNFRNLGSSLSAELGLKLGGSEEERRKLREGAEDRGLK
jgi:hypothetical protein